MKTDDLRYDEDIAFTLADDAATISALVRRTPDPELRAVRIGDWTAKEVIGHIADLAEVFAERVRRCVTEDQPALASVDQDAMQAERRNNDADGMAQKGHRNDGSPYWLARSLRAVLVSAEGRPCIHQMQIGARTNEVGRAIEFLEEKVGRRTALSKVVQQRLRVTLAGDVRHYRVCDRGVRALHTGSPLFARARINPRCMPISRSAPKRRYLAAAG